MASGGDLADFLRKEQRPSQYLLDETFYVALCGLSSAIESVHYYTYTALSLELIGCHGNLKPHNILIEGTKFILGGFGLSKLQADSNQAGHKYAIGDYVAPECIDQDTYECLSYSGHASDIWSFGCVISEILTYMKHGMAGVEEYKNRRKVTHPPWITHTFHNCGQHHAGVATWLSDFENEGSEVEQNLIRLIRNMTQINPSDRPTAKSVSIRLRLMALVLVSQSVEEQLANLPHQSYHYDAVIERNRFKAWVRGLSETEDA